MFIEFIGFLFKCKKFVLWNKVIFIIKVYYSNCYGWVKDCKYLNNDIFNK